MKFLVLKVLEGKDPEYTGGGGTCKTKNNKPCFTRPCYHTCIKYVGPCDIHAC